MHRDHEAWPIHFFFAPYLNMPPLRSPSFLFISKYCIYPFKIQYWPYWFSQIDGSRIQMTGKISFHARSLQPSWVPLHTQGGFLFPLIKIEKVFDFSMHIELCADAQPYVHFFLFLLHRNASPLGEANPYDPLKPPQNKDSNYIKTKLFISILITARKL